RARQRVSGNGCIDVIDGGSRMGVLQSPPDEVRPCALVAADFRAEGRRSSEKGEAHAARRLRLLQLRAPEALRADPYRLGRGPGDGYVEACLGISVELPGDGKLGCAVLDPLPNPEAALHQAEGEDRRDHDEDRPRAM